MIYRVMTNDPSLTAWGVAVIELPTEKIIHVDCITTKAENKKRRIRKGDDNVRRADIITHGLLDVIRKYNIQYVLSELPHGSMNASAAIMLGMVVGILQGLTNTLGIPIDWYSENDAKKVLFGRSSVAKHEVIEAIGSLYTVPFTGIKYKDEAIADALAIYNVSTLDNSIIKSQKL